MTVKKLQQLRLHLMTCDSKKTSTIETSFNDLWQQKMLLHLMTCDSKKNVTSFNDMWQLKNVTSFNELSQ